MLRLVALSLILAASVQAQSTEPRLGQRLALATGALIGGVGTSAGTYALLGKDGDRPGGVALVVLAYPVGMTLAAQLVGTAVGVDAPLVTTAQDVVLGLPVGAAIALGTAVVVGGAVWTVYLVTGSDNEYNWVPALVGGGIGVLVGVASSAVFATRRFEAAPAVLAAPDGDRALGLSIRLGL